MNAWNSRRNRWFLIFPLLALSVVAASTARAQDFDTYEVRLSVTDGRLEITSPTNCQASRLFADVCINGEKPGEIQFSLDTEGWTLLTLHIRDPASNWQDELPSSTYDEFSPFDRNGTIEAEAVPIRGIRVRVANRAPLAVEYRILAVNVPTGQKAEPAFSVIEVGGGAGRQAD